MPRKLMIIAALAVALLGTMVILQNVSFAGPKMHATVQFGVEGLGNRPETRRPVCENGVPPGPPECFASDHDESAEAVDKLVPRNVVISAGGEVTFDNAGGVHQVAIYKAGTTPDDIDDSPGNRMSIPPFAGGAPLFIKSDPRRLDDANVGADLTFKFLTPGKYLVICTFVPHFVDREMYGWVTVK